MHKYFLSKWLNTIQRLTRYNTYMKYRRKTIKVPSDRSKGRVYLRQYQFLSDNEKKCAEKINDLSGYVSRHYAGKKAICSLLGLNDYHLVEIIEDEYGRPNINLSEIALKKANEMGVLRLFVSLTNETEESLAYGVVEID